MTQKLKSLVTLKAFLGTQSLARLLPSNINIGETVELYNEDTSDGYTSWATLSRNEKGLVLVEEAHTPCSNEYYTIFAGNTRCKEEIIRN